MKTKKEIENFTKYVLNEAGTESPSDSFVTNVMDRIQHETVIVPETVYQPVISKKVWVLIGIAFVVCSAFLLTGSSEISLDFLSLDINMSSWAENLNFLSAIEISDMITISVLVFTAMVMVQLFLLMKYTSNKIAVS